MDVKTPTSYEEQVAELKTKGFIINDEDKCKSVLKSIRYYRLTAYLLPFKADNVNYYPDIPIERIYRIYDFDSRLRILLYQFIEEIEIHIRSVLSYYHSHEYGPLGYLDKNNFNEYHDNEKYIMGINNVLHKNRRAPIVKWHNYRYEGIFPFWVVIEFFTFGMLSKFYADVPWKDKKQLSQCFNTNPKSLGSWLLCITNLRNLCAHYSRLYYYKFSAEASVPKNLNYVCQRRIFDYILVMKFLYSNTDKWNNSFVITLSTLINEYIPDIKLNHIGFPDNWEEMLIK